MSGFPTGSRLGVYEITGTLGSGGVIRAPFASDSERIARFGREAKVLASLNHPDIAALYGMDEVGGEHFLVIHVVLDWQRDLLARLPKR